MVEMDLKFSGNASRFSLSNKWPSFNFVYVDATKGWIVNVQGAESDKTETGTPPFICASVSGQW